MGIGKLTRWRSAALVAVLAAGVLALGADGGLVQQGAPLTPNDATGASQFGSAEAVSADGNTVIIGGSADGSNVGAAWVFIRSGGVWTQQGGKLTGGGEVGTAQFGISVALSSDGNTALVGGSTDAGGAGAVWAFTRSGGVWTQQGSKLTGSDETVNDSYFGSSVALSSDGNTALIGGYQDGAGFETGAAWSFTRSGSIWTQEGTKMTANDETGLARFGASVAVSADGNTALIGGFQDNSNTGAAWVFTRSGGVWTQEGSKLTGSDASGSAYVGWSVTLASDGNTALVGGPFDGGSGGAVWSFTRSAGTWSQQGLKLTPNDGQLFPVFGMSVSLAGDGNTALIGGENDNGIGAAWVFTRTAGVLTQSGSKLTSDDAMSAAYFGYTAALSADGSTALIGGIGQNSNAGAAWVFAPAAVPGAPTGVSGVSGDGQATVTWTAPSGSSVDSYTVTATPSGAFCTWTSGPLTCDVTGLTNGTAYSFSVEATNSAGTSPPRRSPRR